MADDIVTKQSQPARKAGCDDIVTRLQEMLDGPVPFIVGREDIRQAANEIDRLRTYINALHIDRQIAASEANNDPF